MEIPFTKNSYHIEASHFICFALNYSLHQICKGNSNLIRKQDERKNKHKKLK